MVSKSSLSTCLMLLKLIMFLSLSLDEQMHWRHVDVSNALHIRHDKNIVSFFFYIYVCWCFYAKNVVIVNKLKVNEECAVQHSIFRSKRKVLFYSPYLKLTKEREIKSLSTNYSSNKMIKENRFWSKHFFSSSSLSLSFFTLPMPHPRLYSYVEGIGAFVFFRFSIAPCCMLKVKAWHFFFSSLLFISGPSPTNIHIYYHRHSTSFNYQLRLPIVTSNVLFLILLIVDFPT